MSVMESAPPMVPAGAAIESASFTYIDERTSDRSAYSDAEWTLVRRLIHTSGDFEFNGLTRFHPQALSAGEAAFRRGAPIIADVAMIRAGLTPRRLQPLGVETHVFISEPEIIRAAKSEGVTRAVQAMRHAHREGLLDGSVVAVGNAPTALLELIRLVKEEGAQPALIIGVPVGFISAAESKEAVMELTENPWISIKGSKGGSTLAVAALHAVLNCALA